MADQMRHSHAHDLPEGATTTKAPDLLPESTNDPVDAWHSHVGGEVPQKAHSEHIDTKSVLFFGFAGFAIVVASVVLTIIYFNWYKNQVITARIENFDRTPEKSSSGAKGLHVEAAARRSEILETQFKSRQYMTANPESKTVRIPMEDAMKKVTEEYGVK